MPPFSWGERAHHMGQLARGDTRWDVYLESRPDEGRRTVWGRLHFVAGERHRQTSWIFLEQTDKEMRERFTDFSATELWALLESLGP